MSEHDLYLSDLLKRLKGELIEFIKGYRFDLRQTTGALPPTQLPPASGGSGSGGGGTPGGVVLENDDPQDVATAPDAGNNSTASRGDHVHALPASGVTPGEYGDATHAPIITFDAQGRATAASEALITGVTPAAHHTTHETGGSDVISGNLDGNARVGIRKNSTGSTFKRRRLNLIEGSNVTLTVADDSTDEEVDITIAASGGGGSLTVKEIDASPSVAATILRFPNGTLTDDGGGQVTYTPSAGSMPSATAAGQLLMSLDGSTFVPVLPITGDRGWMFDEDGYLLVEEG